MARRHSYIQNQITHCLTEMRERVTYTHLEQSGFNPSIQALKIIKPMAAGLKQWKESTPADMRPRMSVSQDCTFVAVVPLPTRWGVHRGYRGRAVLEDDYSFMKWPDYRKQVYEERPGDADAEGMMRGLAFSIVFDRNIVPTRWPSSPRYNSVIDEPDDGIILTPERMGDAWGTYLPALTKLHDLCVLTEYFYEFGRVAGKHCTTEGITKRVWPEAANFIEGGHRSKAIEDSKMSGWPVDLRRRLVDLKSAEQLENNDVTSTYLKGQLHRIGDMILTSKLMMTGKEYTESINQDAEFKINDVDFTTVNLKTGYIKDVAPSLVV